MVFRPEFGQPLDRYQPEFIYHINNENQPKTYNSLALRYFGSEKFAAFLHAHNPLLADYKPTDILPHGEKLIIPSP